MIRERVGVDGRIELIGAVRGLLSEATRVVEALTSIAPPEIGVGLSPEEMAGLREYFVGQPAEPIVPLTSNEVAEARGMVRFGQVSVPSPSFIAALEWAQLRSIPVHALDATEDEGAELFADSIGYVELVRRTLSERRLARRPPTPPTADDYALTWDQALGHGAGSHRFARARDERLVARVAKLVDGRSRVAVLIDRERFALVKDLLTVRSPPSR